MTQMHYCAVCVCVSMETECPGRVHTKLITTKQNKNLQVEKGSGIGQRGDSLFTLYSSGGGC